MTTKNKIDSLARLGDFLLHPNDALEQLIISAPQQNAWFTPENTRHAITATGKMLNHTDLEQWLGAYPNAESIEPAKLIGLVLAGNIPMVGLHDILCVLASGNKALIKLSSQDKKLIPFILNKLVEIEPAFGGSFEFIERLAGFDAVIATGSGNTSRYFEYYFKNVPHIIRRNRNSVAVLDGNESDAALKALGHDIFDYFGLGCRNVSKLFVPQDYNFTRFFEAIEEFHPISDHHKYNNNYDYNKSIFLVNQDKHLDNGFLLLKNDHKLASPLAVLYYEEYVSQVQLPQLLEPLEDQLQCVATNVGLPLEAPVVKLGQTQQPQLWDYADKVDTMAFLSSL
ncbi:acyl-CoA reductase [Flavihumibacter sp. R14]|nr:acyl-CoA reductase [Flavihumibacter soli]